MCVCVCVCVCVCGGGGGGVNDNIKSDAGGEMGRIVQVPTADRQVKFVNVQNWYYN